MTHNIHLRLKLLRQSLDRSQSNRRTLDMSLERKIRYSLIAYFVANLVMGFFSREIHLFDAQFLYSPIEIPKYWEQIGEVGRAAYTKVSICDLLLIIPSYFSLLYFLGEWVDQKKQKNISKVFLYFAVSFDLIETLLLLFTLQVANLENSHFIYTIISLATPLKWMNGMTYFITLASAFLPQKVKV
jgi:hypothetical protein